MGSDERHESPGETKKPAGAINPDRRRLLFAAAATAASVMAGKVLAAEFPGVLGGLGENGNPTGLPSSKAMLPARTGSESTILKMQRELQRALEKPTEKRRWVMIIDVSKCIGCHACTVACKAENVLPPGVVYRPVMEEEIGQYPNVSARYTARPCMQCANPPCTKVCPVGATYKRPDGVIAIDYENCIGCRACLTACPYRARTFDFGEYYTTGTPVLQKYEKVPSPEYGNALVRAHGESPVGNARKCQFCLHRLNAGMLPACTVTCVGAATFFGDINDPDSLVANLRGSSRVIRLKEELGTEPSVYYLV